MAKIESQAEAYIHDLSQKIKSNLGAKKADTLAIRLCPNLNAASVQLSPLTNRGLNPAMMLV